MRRILRIVCVFSKKEKLYKDKMNKNIHMLMQTTIVQQKDMPHRSLNSCIKQSNPQVTSQRKFSGRVQNQLKAEIYIFSLIITLSRPCSASSWWYLSLLSLQVTIP